MKAGDVTLTAGPDANLQGRSEFVLMRCTNAARDEWDIIARQGGFKRKAQAVAAGRRAFQALS